jgi:MFS family permease
VTKRRGPLADSYPAAVALVVCALVPFLALTAALTPLVELVGKDLRLGKSALELTTGMSDAAYAFGTVLAVQFAQHLPARRMLILYVSLFVACAFLAAWAPTRGVFVGALVCEGLCTSLMLIAAVPPLVTGFGADKMVWTGAIMNLCIFGAVAAGPAIGELAASWKSWRTLFWAVAAVSVLALVFACLTYEDEDPHDTSAPWDWVAVALGAVGCVAAFFGAARLESTRSVTVEALVPLVAGIALVVILVVYQYRRKNALMPVRELATTLPVFGILIALCASASAFGLMDMALTALAKARPSHAALLLLPELGAALATAALFGALFRSRYMPVLALSGLVLVCAAAAVLTGIADGGDARVLAGAALVGLGVGASVSPALFIAGFSLRSENIQRVFALIELLRGVGAFLFAPVLLFVVGLASLRVGAWICLGLAAAGTLGAIALFARKGARLQKPDLESWQEGGEPAWKSPPL